MKKIYCLFCFIMMSVALFAQAPESFSYQAIVRDASNQPKANSPVSVRIDILQGSAVGNVVYEETHTVTTDENGMLSLAIGTGTAVVGVFANIDWGAATYFLKSETDPEGGSNYSLTTTQQLVSVPYALYAKSAGNTLSAEEIQQMFDNLRDELANTIDSLNEEIDNLTEELNIPCPGSVSDNEGNLYPTIKLGRQCWMAENLRSTTYLGWPIECGDTIDNTNYGGMFYYSSGDVSKTGYLYPSDVAMLGGNPSSSAPSNIQGICPAGWHLPSAAEWSQLFSYLGGNSSYCCSSNPSYIAKALASQADWTYSSTLCGIGNMPEYNNATGFNVRPNIDSVSDEFGNIEYLGGWASFLTSDPSMVSFMAESPTVEIYSGSGVAFVRCVYGSGSNASDPYAAQPQTPSVITGNVSYVTAHTATAEGSVTDNGTTVTARGICWSSSNQAPTIYDNHSAQGSDNGSFTANLSGLLPSTTYYVRAYATNDAGTNYGTVMVITTISAPCQGNETVTDLEGNVYNTVQIGNQCWMKENLRTTQYADGTPISYGGDNNSYSTAYYYYPNGDPSIVMDYGLLYNWKAAMKSASESMLNPSGVQGVCPTGWHLPSESEWNQLISNVGAVTTTCGNARDFASQTGWNSYSCTPSQWNECCQVGYDMSMNNATGFSAMPAGYFGYVWSNSGYHYGTSGKGDSAVFLSTTQYKTYSLYKGNTGSFDTGSNLGGSVRCVKD